MMIRSLTSLALIALAGSLAQAQRTVRLAVSSDSKLWIEGTSNLHSWSCKASAIDASIDADTGFRDAADFPKYLESVQVKVPVGNLKCGHSQMDKNMYKALRAEDAPQISYILASFDVVKGDGSREFTVKTVGKLVVAGKENTVKMDVETTRLADGSVKATGNVPVLMTDYGIKPPTAMLGTLRTGDQITVKFELTIGPQTIVAAAKP